MKTGFNRILIVDTFGIGDVLFTTPLLRSLKENLPDVEIDFVCNRRTRHMLENNKNISEIMVFEKDEFRDALKKSKIIFFNNIARLLKKIKSKKYDLAIDFSLGYKLSLVLKFLGIRERIGFNFRNRGKFLTGKIDIDGFHDKHAVEYNLDILKLIGMPDCYDKELALDISPQLVQWSEGFIKENALQKKILVALAPGGGKSWGENAPYRRWSPENFVYVAQKLLKKNENMFFMIFGSIDETDLCNKIESGLIGKSINLGGKLTLPKSMALIKKCVSMLCNDGGILHIAVSQKVNTVSIFGPVDDKAYGPYPPSKKHKVVVADKVPCRPCYRNFRHKVCNTHICLTEIDRDKVLRAMEESLNEM